VELTTLRYFRAIARIGHMTRAAGELGVSQPALSASLKKLESEVGAQLLHRTGRGVELTEAGRTFLSYADDALRRAEAGVRAVRQLAGLEAGSIRIGGGATATTYILPPVVSRIRRRHEGLRFYVREAGSTAVAAAVVSGELDLGIVTLPIAGSGGHGKPDLLTLPLVEDELRLVVPPDHRLAKGGAGGGPGGKKQFRWSDIANEPVIAFEAGTAVRSLIDQASLAAGVSLSVVMELRSIESIKRMVAAGIGVGFVSRFALGGGRGGGEVGEGLSCREARLSRSLAIVRRADRIPSPAAAEFEKELVKSVTKSERGG
jgi:DNA-binding transcriptional LysR family regulator